MVYNVEIQEFPDDYLYLRAAVAEGVYFIECNHLRKYISEYDHVVMLRREQLHAFNFVPSGWWLLLKRDDDAINKLNSCRFLERCQPPDSTNETDALRLDTTAILGDFIIAQGSRNDRAVLFVESLNTGRLITKALAHDLSGYLPFDGVRIYGFRWEPTKALLCFDLELNLLWEHDLSSRGVLGCQEDDPQFFQDSLIFNGGPTAVKENEFVITAFAKADGRVIWSRTFEQQPRRSILVGDKLYLALNLNMVVLDAATGKTLVNESTGFKKNEAFRNAQQITVFPAGDSLLAFGQTDQSIRVFTQDGKSLIQEIKLPRPRSPRAFDPFQPDIPSTPLVHHNNIYCKLHHYTGLGAIAILSPTPDSEEPKITIKPRIPYDFSEVPDDQGGHGYQLRYSHDNLDDLVSAARYELMEICQYCGIDRSEHQHFDPLFNGHVIVEVDSAKLPNDAKEELEKMAKAVENFLETFLVRVPFQPFKPKPGETAAKKKGRKKSPSYPRNQFKIEIELHESVPPEHVPEG